MSPEPAQSTRRMFAGGDPYGNLRKIWGYQDRFRGKANTEVSQGHPGGSQNRPDPALLAPLEKANRIVAEGDALLARGKPGEALARYQQARKITTLGGIGLKGMAEAHLRLGEDAAAVRAMRELIYPKPGQTWSASDATDPATLMKFALLLAKTGARKESRDVHRRAVGFARPDLRKYLASTEQGFEASARIVLADSETNGGNQAAAIAHLEKAIQADPESIGARKVALRGAGRLKEARKHFQVVADAKDPTLAAESRRYLSGLHRVE